MRSQAPALAGPHSPCSQALTAACALLSAPQPLPCFAAAILLRVCRGGGFSAQAREVLGAQLAVVGAAAVADGFLLALVAEALAAPGRKAPADAGVPAASSEDPAARPKPEVAVDELD